MFELKVEYVFFKNVYRQREFTDEFERRGVEPSFVAVPVMQGTVVGFDALTLKVQAGDSVVVLQRSSFDFARVVAEKNG